MEDVYLTVITVGASLLNAGALWYKMGRVEQVLADMKEKRNYANTVTNQSHRPPQIG